MNDIEILEDITVTSFNTSNIYLTLEKVNKAIENILKERQADKEKIEELEELEEELNSIKEIYYTQKEIEDNYIPKALIEEKKKEDIKTNEHTILGGRRNGKTLEYGRRLGRIEMCDELLKTH